MSGFGDPVFDPVEIIAESMSGRDLAEFLADSDNPDWHCTVHGEWGDGEYACSYREPGPSGCYGQY
jgi:hypothetical protein